MQMLLYQHPFTGTLSFPTSLACITCNKEIQDGIWNSQFYPNLAVMLSAFFVLAIIVGILATISTRKHKAKLAAHPSALLLSPAPLSTASMVLGIGLGGFADGIVLHQILQWHEMLSAKIPSTDYVGKSVNMFWDGIFHAFCLLVTLIGIILLWRLLKRKDINRSGKLLAGGMLMGWGLFNVGDGLIDHQVLGLHHVRPGPGQLGWDLGFLALGAAMAVAGFALSRKSSRGDGGA